MADTFEFTLDEESEKKLFEIMTDVDVSKTPSFSIKDKHGNEAEYLKVVRCKDCKFHHDRTQCSKRIGAWFDDDYCNGAVSVERKEE